MGTLLVTTSSSMLHHRKKVGQSSQVLLLSSSETRQLFQCILVSIRVIICLSKINLKKSLRESLRKIPKFHLISWCRNFVERHSLRRVSGELSETLWKLGEISAFYAVNAFNCRNLCRVVKELGQLLQLDT